MDERVEITQFQQEMNKLLLEFTNKAKTLVYTFTEKTLEANKHSKFRVNRIVQTSREREIMEDVLAGLQYKEIATKRNIHKSTVKYYVSRFLKRSGLASRRELEKIY